MQKYNRLSLFFTIAILINVDVLAQHLVNEPDLKVNKQRIEQHILELSKFGRDSMGRGNRVAFSKGDIKGRAFIYELMKKAGLTVHIDAAGNIVGSRAGRDSILLPIAMGSHTDMVPHGGNYDGVVGVISAIEVIQVLQEHHILTQHPLQVIDFTDEEGGVIGSHAMAGNLNQTALHEISSSGLTIAEGIRAIGGNPDKLVEAKKPKGSLAAYLELHIEQGNFLENEKKDIGIVEGIVGIEEWEVTINGFANHAGTTPMLHRQDALLAAAKLIVAINEVVKALPGRQVCNVGKIAVEPGAPNVIPGKAVMSLELRDLDEKMIWDMFKAIEVRADSIATETGTRIKFNNLHISSAPALMNRRIQDIIQASATQLGYTYKVMPSGAGHDAQEMALLAPAGMIFIPSVGGISHSPKEYSTPDAISKGANILLQSILKLDQQ
ncbi:MAG: hydantoinase/carbamoylase family amidase [Sphingobacteriales bacterium]|uniref:Zn-dependent hydrolase n=1 Tax=Hydrotalea flava TaxID=714549 RepID=UPI00082F29DB|nr:Zn-dependent hydrolase [Hydrotalea flava]RTL48843.1 MAG: hydantoinase/carbamoylase family amidase [Sphingobacteriales bacterium]